jgi:inhibitor of KinA
VEYTFAAMGTTASGGVKFQLASDQALIVYFDPPVQKSGAKPPHLQNRITMDAHERVRRLLRLVELEPIAGVRNLHPAYCSLLFKFDAMKLRHEELEEVLRGYIGKMGRVALPEPRVVEIPVCYGGEFGPDLNAVAELQGITIDRAIELHAVATYVVYFLGFVPGFELATPRLATPRRSVPPGSVGIAGRQTGVYPVATPGGWRLLGRTPAKMFQPNRAEMSLLSIGDRVRFVPISREQFANLENA